MLEGKRIFSGDDDGVVVDDNDNDDDDLGQYSSEGSQYIEVSRKTGGFDHTPRSCTT